MSLSFSLMIGHLCDTYNYICMPCEFKNLLPYSLRYVMCYVEFQAAPSHIFKLNLIAGQSEGGSQWRN